MDVHVQWLTVIVSGYDRPVYHKPRHFFVRPL